MMRTTARLHANLTTRLNRLEEDSEPICSRQFPSPYHLLVAIDPMHLKYRLCQIYANTHKLHGGPLLSVNWSMTLPVWHLDAVQVRRVQSFCLYVFFGFLLKQGRGRGGGANARISSLRRDRPQKTPPPHPAKRR